jgi:Tfp pilus assembly protein PilN
MRVPALAAPAWARRRPGGGRSVGTTAPAAPLAPIDLNLLPAAYRAPRRRLGQFLLWLTIGLVALGLVPIGLEINEALALLEQTQTAIVSTETQLSDVRQVGAQHRQLRTTLSKTQAEISRLGEVRQQIRRRQMDWSPLLATVDRLTMGQVAVTGLIGTPERLEVDGHAGSTEAILAYAQRLQASGAFRGVTLTSIGISEAPPGRRGFRLTATPEVGGGGDR